MGIKNVHHEFQLAAARGHLPAHLVGAATLATILESGVTAFQRAYFGPTHWDNVRNELQANAAGAETAGTLQESLLTDISAIRRPLRESMTTSDLAGVLGTIRSRVLRKTFNPVESDIFSLATKRTAQDFRLMQGYRVDPFSRLALRPESTDVTYANWGITPDGYRVSNYELAIAYTWEMWVNDDLGVFVTAMENLGVAGRRNRALIVFEAIAAQLTRTVLGTAGGPDVAHVQAAIDFLNNQTSAQGGVLPFDLTDIAIPSTWRTQLATTLNSERLLGLTGSNTPEANPVYQAATPHREPMMKEILGQDWLAWDNRYPWLEFATLAGFEGGPKTYTKLPNVQEHIDEGSFENHALAVKVGDAVGAFVTQTQAVVRVAGS